MNFSALKHAPLRNIMIIGSSGSGKSTLARQIGDLLDLRVIHIDKIYWEPNWVLRSQDEIEEGIIQAMKPAGWVFEGNHSRTLHLRAEQADTIIWIDLPRWRCILRGLIRSVRNYGRGRADMADGCVDRMTWALIRWQWRYATHGRKTAQNLLNTTRNSLCQITLHTPQEVEAFVEYLHKNLQERKSQAA